MAYRPTMVAAAGGETFPPSAANSFRSLLACSQRLLSAAPPKSSAATPFAHFGSITPNSPAPYCCMYPCQSGVVIGLPFTGEGPDEKKR